MRRRLTLTRVSALLTVIVLGVATAIAVVQRGADGAEPPVSEGITDAVATRGVTLTPVLPNASGALGVAAAPGRPDTIYVTQQQGLVESVSTDGSDRRTVLDLSDRVVSGGEQGLLGLAFDPRHQANGLVYVHYTDTEGDVRVSELTMADGEIDPDSERELLTVPQPGDTHNGGQLAFGPDGYLYAAFGDGGGVGAPRSRGQFREDLLGTIVRIDPTPDPGGEPYRIPPDNPFTDDPEASPEIYVYGLRNPWRFSFDRDNGDLWIGDVGHDLVEEMTVLRSGSIAGANLGWDAFEGTRSRLGPTGLIGDEWVRPTIEYSHDFGCSVTGGHVYRGEEVPSLDGRYVFSDFCSGIVWSADATTGGDVRQEAGLGTDLAGVTTFGEDADGELYVVGAGTVYRFAQG